jgi:hypothetical protein
MKYTAIFLLFLILFSCKSTNSDLQKRIDLFENHIGLENAKGLNQLTAEFENFLTDKYPNEKLDSAYTFFLRTITAGYSSYQDIGINKDWEIRFRKIINQTNLQNELYLFTDSVWFENNEVKYSSCYFGEDTICSESGSIFMRNGDNEDSVLVYMEQLKNSRDYNINGKYQTGLDLIKGGYSGSFCASDFGWLVPGISVQTVPVFTV